MEEMCPSPVARRLITKRSDPGGSPSWLGCGTTEGLNSAAHSSAYSLVKNEPMSRRRVRSGTRSVIENRATRW